MTMDFNTSEGQLAAMQGSIIGGPAGSVITMAAVAADMQAGLSQQGKFEVDPERLPQLKADLEAVYDEAKSALETASRIPSLPAPAEDEVSTQSMNNIQQVVTMGDGSLIKTCEDIMKWVESFQDQVETAIAEYQRIDDENRMA